MHDSTIMTQSSIYIVLFVGLFNRHALYYSLLQIPLTAHRNKSTSVCNEVYLLSWNACFYNVHLSWHLMASVNAFHSCTVYLLQNMSFLHR